MRSHVKPLMLVGTVLVLGFILFPHRKTVSQRADRVIDQWNNNRLPLADEPTRKELVSLFQELERAGEERRMAQVGPVFMDEHFTKDDLQAVAFSAFSLFHKWNDAPPAWKWDLYQKLMSIPGDHVEAPYCVLHNPRTPVEFRFHSKNTYQQLYLVGNWTPSGRLAQFQGFRPQKLVSRGQGVWSVSVSMQKSHSSHAFHAVVRTAPWPEGRAVGWTTFRLSGEHARLITIQEQTPKPVPLQPSRDSVPNKSRVLLLGIDGASWHALLPLIQRGQLPHWSRLMTEGTAARLIANGGRYAYASLPSIHTALTGYVPARHQTKKEFFGFSIRPSIPRVWNIASDQGLQVATVGVWGTFPVERIRGAMVSEAFFFIRAMGNPVLKEILYSPWTVNFAETFGVQKKDFDSLLRLARWVKPYVETVYPEGLESRILEVLPPLPLSTKSDFATLTSQTYDECIYRASRYLLQQHPYDLMVNYLIEVDSRQHISWQDFEPLDNQSAVAVLRKDSEDAFIRSYQNTDSYIGEMMAKFDQIVIFSDHGMSSIPSDHYHPFCILDSDKLARTYHQLNPSSMPIDFSLTQLSRYDYRLIVRSSTETIVSFLTNAEMGTSGERIFTVAPDASADHPGQFIVKVRVRFDRLDDRIHLGHADVGLSDLFLTRAIAADHAGNGVMVVWGKGNRAGEIIPDAYEEDVAATALYLLDLPISTRMDGRPLIQAVQQDYLNAHPVRWTNRTAAPTPSVISILRSIRWKRLLGRH